MEIKYKSGAWCQDRMKNAMKSRMSFGRDEPAKGANSCVANQVNCGT